MVKDGRIAMPVSRRERVKVDSRLSEGECRRSVDKIAGGDR